MKRIVVIVLLILSIILVNAERISEWKEKAVPSSAGNTEITTETTVPSTTEATTGEETTTEPETTVTITKKDEKTTANHTTTQKQTTTKQQTTTQKQTTTKPSTTKETTTKKPTTTKAATCTNNGNHSQACGNMDKWFNSKSDVKAYVDKEMKYWADLEESGEITREEYYKKCPSGYECWSCGYCGKWTGNFKY